MTAPTDTETVPQRPAWSALLEHLNQAEPLPPAIIRAAFIEYKAMDTAKQQDLLGECMELRADWEILAEVICPIAELGNVKHLVVDTKPPQIPAPRRSRFIPAFLRRFFK